MRWTSNARIPKQPTHPPRNLPSPSSPQPYHRSSKANRKQQKEQLYEAYNLLHSLAQDFQKPFDATAILIVGQQTGGKSALIEALMGFQFNQVGGGTKTRRPIALRMQYNPRCSQPHCFLTLDNGKEEARSLKEIQVRLTGVEGDGEWLGLARDLFGKQRGALELTYFLPYFSIHPPDSNTSKGRTSGWRTTSCGASTRARSWSAWSTASAPT